MKRITDWADESDAHREMSSSKTEDDLSPSRKILKSLPTREAEKAFDEMFNRKKLDSESMLEYYQDKVAMCIRCKLSNNATIYCIIRGLPIELQSNASAYQCETPDELFEGFLCTFDGYWPHTSDQQVAYKDPVRLNETQNTFMTCSFTKRPEVEIRGVHPLQVTSDKSKSNDESKRRTNIYENFSLSGSPSYITQTNYNSKSSLKNRSDSSEMIADMIKLTLDRQLITDDDSQSDLEEPVMMVQNQMVKKYDFLSCDVRASNSRRSSVISVVSSSSSGTIILTDYEDANDTLRPRLGVNPEPIQNTTRTRESEVSSSRDLKKLAALKSNPIAIEHKESKKTYSVELAKSLENDKWLKNLSPYIKLQSKIQTEFQNSNRIWRGGNLKTSFTYLLLDPRITENLPAKASHQPHQVSWATFINSIFYIGKGIRSRPFSHLYQALTPWKCNTRKSDKKKIQHILDIWSDNLGVICLHVFQNVIAVEAYTNEASMIDVIRLKNLKNEKVGNYYGVAKEMSQKERHMLGLFLLNKAFNIYIHEGEKQLRPDDIKAD